MPTITELNEKAKSEFGVDDNLEEITVEQKYRQLKEKIIENFGEQVWSLLEACLSTIATLFIKDLANPVGLNLIGNPSTKKTTVLSMLYGLPIVYRCDNFTVHSFVSHAANRTTKQLNNDVDLLPRIRHKCIIVPELAPIFGLRKEDLVESFSILVRVFDGEGLMTDSGSHGRRGYEGEYPFAWLGASTPLPQEIWNIMGQLGSRMLFLAVNGEGEHEERMKRGIGNLYDTPYPVRIKDCRAAVREFIDFLIARLNVSPGPENKAGDMGYLRVISWDISREEKDILEKITRLAELTSRARSRVPVWKSEGDADNKETGYSQPFLEGIDRILSVLIGLAQGHAIICGRRQLTEDDLPLIVAISLSSMPDDRRQVIDLLVDPDHPDKSSARGEVTSTEITNILTYCRHTTLKILERLDKLKVGKLNKGDHPMPAKFTLHPSYSWLLTDEFAAYWKIWGPVRKRGDSEDIPF
jgi:hypothetical protein